MPPKGGPKDTCPKACRPRLLLQAIKVVHSGGIWIDKEIPCVGNLRGNRPRTSKRPRSRAAHRRKHQNSHETRDGNSSDWLPKGLTNEEIGKKIFISEKTVKTHLTNIFDKLKVNNRFKAALMLMGHPELSRHRNKRKLRSIARQFPRTRYNMLTSPDKITPEEGWLLQRERPSLGCGWHSRLSAVVVIQLNPSTSRPLSNACHLFR